MLKFNILAISNVVEFNFISMILTNKKMYNNIIAVFPIGLVLLPNMVMPLHIFEERYKILVSECLENHTEFGIVYYSGTKILERGCTAKIIEVTKKYPDGRMDILVEGVERFKILDSFYDKPYMSSEVEFFDDLYDTDETELKIVRKEGVELLKKVMAVYKIESDDVFLDNLSAKVISFLLVSNSGFSMNEKQFFLEMINTKERLEKGVKILKKLSDRLKTTLDIQKIIESNGYLGSKKH